MTWLKQSVGMCVLLALTVTAVWAEEKKKVNPGIVKPAAEKPAAVAAEDIPKLIKQLDADKFADRQAASEKLHAAGKPAVPALADAAIDGSPEVIVRAIDLLQRFYDSKDKAAKQAAKEGLEKVAQSDNASAARRAQQVLKPAAAEQPQPPGMNVGNLKIQFGGLNPAGGMNVRQVNVTNINGAKKIDAEDGDRKISILQNADDSIQMEITEKVNGKDVTKKFEAKNPHELKRKSPKAFETYQEFAERNNGLGGAMPGINFGAMPGALPAMPGLPQQLGPMPGMQIVGPGALKLEATMDGVDEMLKTWSEQLKSVSADLESQTLMPEEKKEIRTQIKELKKQLDFLERRLQKTVEKPQR